MALRFIESVGMYGPSANERVVIFGAKWDVVLGTFTLGAVPTGARRAGTRMLEWAWGGAFGRTIPATATVYTGCRLVQARVDDNDLDNFVQFRDGTTQQVAVRINRTTRKFEAYRGGAFLGDSGAYAYQMDEAHYVEVGAHIADSGGWVEVRVDGVPVLSVTGVDTQSTAAAQVTQVVYGRISTAGNGPILRAQDFYICDGSGSTANGFLGLVACDPIRGTADGHYTGGTLGGTTTPTTRWGAVDDALYWTAAPEPDYVQLATAGASFSVALADLDASATTVLGVQTLSLAKRLVAATSDGRHFLRRAGADVPGTTHTPGTSYGAHVDVRGVDPFTAAPWTVAGVNGLELGYETVSVGGSSDIRVEMLLAEVLWSAAGTPPPPAPPRMIQPIWFGL